MTTPHLRLLFAAVALLAIGIQLGWEASHGGIVVHHFLQRDDLPGVSNAWGLLIVPALAAWTAGRVPQCPWIVRDWLPLLVGFGVPLVLGAALSMSFVSGAGPLTEAIFLTMLALATLLPAYRRECVFGLVLGACLSFGPVLPLVLGTILAGISWLLHRCARWAFRRVMPA